MTTERELGALDARTSAVERDVREIKADVKAILAKLNEANGFRAGLMLIIASGGGLVATAAHWITGYFGGPK